MSTARRVDATARRARRIWLFDLDDTLHDASAQIFPHINRAMTAYVAEHLHLDEAAASQLRVHYWQRYGATLLGLMRHHGTDPNHFLHHTHQFDDLPGMIVAEPGLRHALRRLPGRKVVFSNAPLRYARDVLAAMGVLHLFDDVYSIERSRFQPKPSRAGMRRLLRRLGVAACQCILVEDSLANLRAARALGMHTVLVARGPRRHAAVELRIKSVRTLPRHLARFR